jgi:flagellar hook protein FlgE
MIDSIYIALSGMRGHERGLNVISSNVANLNTTGYRGSTVSFSDVFSGSGFSDGANSPLGGQQSFGGGGLDASRTRVDFGRADPRQTGNDLDLFLTGPGFFVLQDEVGEYLYTRNGSFEFNPDGELVAVVPGGQANKVMARNVNGLVAPVELKGLRQSAPKATGEVTFDGTLSSDDSTHTVEPVVVFDKLGGAHTLRVVFDRDPGTAVNWKITVFEGDQSIGTGSLPFTGASVAPGASPLRMTLALKGTDAADISFNFDAVSGVAVGAQSSMAARKQDGFAPGTITATKFDENGLLKVTYSNGQTTDGPKLVLAQIQDENALVAVGNAAFKYEGSEPVTLREAGIGLKVQGGSVEPSNVDLTQQFSDLILMQRGYQASSQVLSTANDMLQELLDMKGRG